MSNIDGSHMGTNYGTSTTMYSGGAMVPFPSALSHFYCNEIQTCIVEGVTYQNSTPYPASLGTCTYTYPYHYCEVYCGTTYLGTIGFSGALPLDKDKKLTVSPNPFKNILNLSFESNSERVTISIFNLLGEEIMTKYTATNIGQNEIQLNNLNQLSNGIYILKIAFNDGTFLTKKIMHQK